MTKEKKFERGITLIALIITVIIMVILAAISINSIYNMGIVEKAVNGSQKYAQESVEENQVINESEGTIQNTINKLETIYNGLPSQYQKVEYIESTGTQWIDTEFKPTDNTDFEIVSKAIYNGCENGSSNGWQNNSLILVSFASNKGVRAIYNSQFYYDYGMSEELGIKFTKLKITHDGKFYVNENLVKEFSTSSVANNYTIKLFLASYGDILGGESGQISNSRIWNNDKLIRNFIPCYCTTTVTNVDGEICEAGTIGLYDTVEGKFYTNQGEGTFLKGADVN